MSPNEVPESIALDIFDSKSGVADSAIARLVPNQNDGTNAAVYEYSLWAHRGQKITLVPRDSRYVSMLHH